MDEEHTHGNPDFQAFLTEHELQPLDVALHSGVRYITVWNILKNNPVSAQHAAQVRAGLYKMAGVHYWGTINT